MKIFRKTISALLSLSISAAAIAVPVISASAEESGGVHEILEFSSTGFAEAGIDNKCGPKSEAGLVYGCKSITENARMFDKTNKYSAMKYIYDSTNKKPNNQSYSIGTTKSVYVSKDGYISLWVYSNKAVKHSSGEYSNIGICLSNNDKAGTPNANCLRYNLPVNWNTGWQCVTVKVSDMKDTNFDTSKPIQSFRISSNYTDDGNKWNVEAGSVLFDYIYYTETEPPTELTAAAPTYMEAVANNTQIIPFDFSNDLKDNTVHSDCVSVSVNGEALTSGYSIAVDGNDASKLNVVFDKPLEFGANYQINVDSGAVYDVYGNAAKETCTAQFTVNSDFDITEKSVNDIAVSADGEGDVSVVFNGDISTAVTKDSISITPALDYDVTVNENKLNISFTNAKANTEYAVNVENVPYKNNENLKPLNKTFTFTTGSGAYVIYKAENGLKNVTSAQALTGSEGYGYKIKETAKASMVNDNARSYDETLLYTIPDGFWEADTKRNYGQNFLEFKNEFSLNDGYDYVNFWIYSDALPTDSSGNPSTVSIFLSQDDMNALADTGYRYILSINWKEGWNLVSIPISEFATLKAADPNSPVKAVTLAVNYTTGGGKRWNDGGKLKIDYIYLSKGNVADKTAATLKADSEEIKGNNVAFTADRTLMSIVHSDNVSVKADGEVVNNYSLAVDAEDNTKLILTLDDVTPDTTYSVEINKGAVYDVYGKEVTYSGTFTSQQSDFAVKTPNITIEGANAKLSAKVVVNDGKSHSVTLIAAQYDKDDRFVKAEIKTCDVLETGTIKLDGINVMSETEKIKAMVWNMACLASYTDVVTRIVE